MPDIKIPYKPREPQLELHRLMASHRFGVAVCHRRMGKALDINTPIQMACGRWSVMGELQDGDVVFGSDGRPTTILMAHPVLFNRKCYEVEFASGEVIVADEDHLWSTTQKKDRHNPTRTPLGRINKPRPPQARTTKEIADTLRSRGEFNHRIIKNKPLHFKERDFIIDPYMLGVWLGDGTSRAPHITSEDYSVIARCAKAHPEWKLNKLKSDTSGNADLYSFTGGLLGKLRLLGVYRNKHIPEDYLTGSIEQRVNLLRGLMDTDGYISIDGTNCEFTQKSEAITAGMVQLLHSLGMTPRVSEKVIDGTSYWRTNFRATINPFYLKHKAARYKDPADRQFIQSIIRVTPVPTRPVRCITVDAPDSLYLVGRKYTVTHNTYCAVAALVDAAVKFDNLDLPNPKFGYIAPYYKQAKKVTWDYFKMMAYNLPGTKFYESDLRVDFGNGAQIHLFGGDNPDALRGMYLDGVVIDEVADSKPNLWGEVIRPALSDRNGWALFIGTFKGVDTLYDLYQMAMENPEWFAAVYKASQTGLIAESELESAKSGMTHAQYMREFECDPMAGADDVLVPMVLAESAAQKQLDDIHVKGAVRVLGVDVARYGNDKSVIFPVAGMKAYEPEVYEKIGNIELAHKLINKIESFQPDYVRIDAGRGEGVIDYLRANGYAVMEVPFGGSAQNPLYFNMRSEMLHGVLNWIERGGVIPDNRKLKNEMSSPYVGKNDQGKLIVESKKAMKARGIDSTDLLDALALAVGYPLRAPTAAIAKPIKKKTSSTLGTVKRFANTSKRGKLSRRVTH